MSKHTVIFKNETLTLTEGLPTSGDRGFWLYDNTRGMNLSMKAESERAAFIECILYYQKRLSSVEKSLDAITSRVHSFMEGEGWEEIDEDKNNFYSNYK